MFTKIILPALSVIVLFGAAGTVQAQNLMGREATHKVVQINDADLQSASGLKTIYAQLEKTARKACDSGVFNDRDIEESDRACAREALNNAVADLNQPALSQLHAEKTGQAPSVYADRRDGQTLASK
ncbi:UrcA family protein [Asticcacaulis sp. DW145]|uniref:UrcA family protein n=1 Tax=unclassified Asticcacaulis TaxID=2628350 RepID=UPI003090341E|nr:UrcA family protein [Asticcacaulis sp. DW145]